MDAMDNGLEQRVERAAVGGPRYAQWLALGYLVGIVLCALVIYAEFRQIDRLEVNDHVPTPLGDAVGDVHQLIFGREVHQTFDEVEAHTTHTSAATNTT